MDLLHGPPHLCIRGGIFSASPAFLRTKIFKDSVRREFKMYDYARNWVLLITSMGLIVWLTVMVFPG